MAKKFTSTTLGLSMAPSAAGWTLTQESGVLPDYRQPGDPLTLALEQTAEGDHIDLICYSDDASFAQSQAARDGLTREEHIERVKTLREQLSAHNRTASIKWVTVNE